MLKKFCLNREVKVLYMNSTEAESVKLFSNAYLALRVAFFNELTKRVNRLETYLGIRDGSEHLL